MEKSPRNGGAGGKLSVREQLTRNREELAALISRTSSLRQRVSIRASSSLSPDVSADGSSKGSQKGSRRALADVVFAAPPAQQTNTSPAPLHAISTMNEGMSASSLPSSAPEAENRWLKGECERMAAQLKAERAAKAELEDDLADTVQVLRDVTAFHKVRASSAAHDVSELIEALDAEKRRAAHLEAENVRMALKVNHILESISQAVALDDDADEEAKWKSENALLRSVLNATQ